MSEMITVERIESELFGFIPDARHGGTAVDWEPIKAHLEEIGLGVVAGAMIGEPLNVSRNGPVFTARGKGRAETLVRTSKGPIRVFVDPVVVITVSGRTGTLYVTDISGVQVQHQFAPKFTRAHLNAARIRRSGTDFLIDANVGGMTVPLTVDQQGNVR